MPPRREDERRRLARALPWAGLAAALLAGTARAQSLDIPFLDVPPTLDGALDEAAWKKASQAGEFLQFQPQEGAPMSEKTVAYLGRDEKNLYVAFHALDSEPAKLRAHLAPRDQAFSDDWVILLLDTFGDQRRAYEFLCNPLGVQMDLFNAGGAEDESRDFVWYSSGRVLEDGYSVEMRIPFKSLRLPKAAEQPWRLYVGRNVRRKNEKGFWPPFRVNNGSLLSQMASVRGLAGVRPGKRLEFIPELTASRPQPPQNPEDSWHLGRVDARLGANLRLGLTPNWTLDAAGNPDFSQIEADQPRIEVNQRFPLFYAEKRPFFMEGADHFSTPLKLVHTRTIVDPSWGVKLSGKEGRYAGAALSAEDRSRGGSRFHIARLSADVGKESSLGVLYSGRELSGAAYNRVAGLDGRARLGKLYVLKFQSAGSLGRTAGAGTSEGTAHSVSLTREARDFEFGASYRDIHPRFRADSGFLTRTGIRQAGADLARNFWRERGRLLRVQSAAGYWRTYEHAGVLSDEETYLGLSLFFPLQTSISLFGWPGTLERFQGVDFRKRRASFDASSEPCSAFSAGVSASLGDQIDYTAASPYLARGREGSASLTLKLNSRLNLQQTYLKSRLDTVGGARVFDENVHRTRLLFQWSKAVSSRVIYQYGTLAHGGLANALLSYAPVPGTAVHLGYDVSFARAPAALKKTADTVFGKVSYLFRL